MTRAWTDALARDSAAAVARALSWYLDKAREPRGPLPMPVELVWRLRLVSYGMVPPSEEAFDAFVAFGDVMRRLARLAPDVPACNVGDVLTARTTYASNTPHWPFRPNVDPHTATKLGFAESSTGIANVRSHNREGWDSHAHEARASIEEAARRCPRRQLVVVLGCGNGFDVPLETLVAMFERVILVDVNLAAVEEAMAALAPGTREGRRIEARELDLTGVNRRLVEEIDVLLSDAHEATAARLQVEALIRSYHLAQVPTFVRPGEHPDLVVSSCLLTQLAWPARAYASSAFVDRFRALDGEAERSWSSAWGALELRMQQDHLTAVASAGASVIVSDVLNNLTQLDRAGIERTTGEKVAPLGVGSLLERIPTALTITEHRRWWWPRHRPGPRGEPGSLMSVEAVALAPYSSPP